VKYWLHNGLVQLGEEKMSKSLGNLITIKEALKKYSADAIRIFAFSSHYRSPLTYSEEALEAAERGAERLLRVISRDDPTGGNGEALDAEPYRKQFNGAMDDDFNTPQALAVLFDLARKINEAGDAGVSIGKAQSNMVSLAREVLGLNLRLPRTISLEVERILIKDTVKATVIPDAVNKRVRRLVEERANCRKVKKWQRADEIRSKLAELGVILEDTKTGRDIIYKLVPSEESLENLMKELGIYLQDTPQKDS